METKYVLEAALLSADEPLAVNDLKHMFEDSEQVNSQAIEAALEELATDMTNRPVQLVKVATGWRIQTRPELARYIERLTPEKAPKYSRAVMETLAIVAYRQPVTRGDIEEIRGVSVSAQIVKTLEDRGWIDVIGHKEVLGRPALFGTTHQFLDDLGLQSLNELPSIDDLAQNDDAVEMLSQKLVELSRPEGEGDGVAGEDDDQDTVANHEGAVAATLAVDGDETTEVNNSDGETIAVSIDDSTENFPSTDDKG